MRAFKILLVFAVVAIAVHEASAIGLCEQSHLPTDPYIKRPIDSFKTLNFSRRKQLSALQVSQGVAYRTILKARQLGLIFDYSENLETFGNNLKKSLQTKQGLSPFSQAEQFKSLMSEMTKEAFETSSVEAILIKSFIEKTDYELKNPYDVDTIRSRTATPEMRKAILEEFPELQKSLDQADTTASRLSVSKFITDASEIPFSSGHRKKARQKLLEASPEVRQALTDAYNTMQNREAFAQYFKDLILDTAVMVKQRGDAKEIELLKTGVVPDRAAMAILVLRFKSRGTKIAIIGGKSKEVTNDIFRAAAKQSAMIDFAFSAGGGHGQEIHFVQVDYVHSAIYNATKGDHRLFWDYIGSKKGIWFWYDLFDSVESNPTQPEYFGPEARDIIKFR